MDWQPYTARAREWFESLRTRICAEFEAIERETGSEASFDYLEWQREEKGNADPGGGVLFFATHADSISAAPAPTQATAQR